MSLLRHGQGVFTRLTPHPGGGSAIVGGIGSRPAELAQVNTIGTTWRSVSSDGVYGFGGITSIERIETATLTEIDMVATPFGTLTGITAGGTDSVSCTLHTTGGALLAAVRNLDDQLSFVYRCADPVAAPTVWTAAPVINLGDDGISHVTIGNGMLTRQSMINITLGDGAPAQIAAEYNSNSGVQRCQLWISTDDGVTFTRFWQAVTAAGTLHFRHFHGVYQNPDNNQLLVLIGDTGDQACMLQGPAPPNAAAAAGYWSSIDDTAPAGIVAAGAGAGLTFNIQFGAQRNRLIQVAFIGGWIVTCCDASDVGETGFRAYRSSDLSDEHLRWLPPRQTPTDPEYDTDIIGIGAHQLPNGDWLFAEWITSGYTGGRMAFYTTTNGTKFFEAATVDMENPTTGGAHGEYMFNDAQGNIWIMGTYGLYIDDVTNKNFIVEQLGPWRGSTVLAV